MAKTYTATIRVAEATQKMADLQLGQLFADADIIGFGLVWMGFDVFVKVSTSMFVSLDNGSFREFDPERQVRLVTWRGVDRSA